MAHYQNVRPFLDIHAEKGEKPHEWNMMSKDHPNKLTFNDVYTIWDEST